jgi:phosphoribosylformylglycinamidine synthase subunit PurL
LSALTANEISHLRKSLRRHPTETEFQMVTAQWSEHCSYKSSRKDISQLPLSRTRIGLNGGFDAGLIEIGNDLVLTVRIESHNHPSAIEPYGGAATGVGGVVRDILSAGTRPIALMNGLRFGNINGNNPKVNQHTRWLLRNVVRGISDYGNCIGVPTIGGELEFDKSFDNYCLVDVLCIGLSKTSEVVPNFADTEDLIFLLGGSTGRDGIHGAAFASAGLNREDRSAVQIPDPFLKKILIEAILEAVEKGYINAMKDLGGGGLACCLSETSHSLGKGFDVDLSRVRLREEGMTPTEILISESQERMFLIAGKENRESLEKIFAKYEIGYSVIGKVCSGHNIKIRHHSKVIADIPSQIVACAPLLNRRSAYPSYLRKKAATKQHLPKNLSPILLDLLGTPNLCNRSWIYEQFDSEVGLRTVLRPGEGDSSILRLVDGKYVAMSLDGNCRRCYLDPYQGTLGCLSEAVRNVICSGASPVGLVDHLQFGSPENPEVFWTFKQSIAAIKDYCDAFKLPVIGGKVSFYNEKNDSPIKPSPVIGAIGIGDKLENIGKARLSPRCHIFVIGSTKEELGGSEYYLSFHKSEGGKVPRLDFAEDKRNAMAVSDLIANGVVKGVHDCSKGGIAIALAESAINGNTGFDVDLSLAPNTCDRIDSLMFSESNSRYVVITERPKELSEILTNCKSRIYCRKIGHTSDSAANDTVQYRKGNQILVNLELEKLRLAYNNSLENMLTDVGI